MDLIASGTRDLPAGDVTPQPSTLLRWKLLMLRTSTFTVEELIDCSVVKKEAASWY
jgi:hypothetical protein